MTERQSTRLNGVIRAWEEGRRAFLTFAPAHAAAAVALSGTRYDGVVFDLEHNPYDIIGLRTALQYLLDRRQILDSGTLAPVVTPLVRIPANGAEMNQWMAKQVLDAGIYGVVWPHISTVEQARNAVAACRYPRRESAPIYDPPGVRGDGPRFAARYWGLTQQAYYQSADVWPLAPHGEILVGIICEELSAIANLPRILSEVPGIGAVLIGEGDLTQEMGIPRQYDHPELQAAIAEIVSICRPFDIPVGHAHVNADNVRTLIQQGFRWLMAEAPQSHETLEFGLKLAGRVPPEEPA